MAVSASQLDGGALPERTPKRLCRPAVALNEELAKYDECTTVCEWRERKTLSPLCDVRPTTLVCRSSQVIARRRTCRRPYATAIVIRQPLQPRYHDDGRRRLDKEVFALSSYPR